MAVNKSELLNKLKADMNAADKLRLEWFNKISDYRNQTYQRPYGNEVKGKSQIVSGDIRKQLE